MPCARKSRNFVPIELFIQMKKATTGDHVRFLNASESGVVRRVEKNVAWVETPDGFEIPTPLNQLVVVDPDAGYASGYKTPAEKRQEALQAKKKETTEKRKTATTPRVAQESKQVTKPLFVESPVGEELSLYAAFLPVDFTEFGQTPYELYLVNDSNYYCSYTYAARTTNGRYRLRVQGILEPDSTTFVEEFNGQDLGQMEYLLFQFLPYKVAKGYLAKKPVNKELKINGVKFFKRHSFCATPFFEEDALVYTIMERGQDPTKPKNNQSSANESLKELQKKIEADLTPQQPKPAPKPKEEPVKIVDLHIEQLLESHAGMTPHEILLYQIKVFDRELNKHLGNKGEKVIFIHGKGQGVLRESLFRRIEKQELRCSHRDASFKEFGFGAIEVTFY